MTKEKEVIEMHRYDPEMSYSELGRELGCSREMARYYLHKNGLSAMDGRRNRPRKIPRTSHWNETVIAGWHG